MPEEGGPEQAAEHSGRAMLLVWPDYLGRGSYAKACLDAYGGDTLLLVGEWRGRTFGSYASGLAEEGQAFSAKFQ